MLLGVGEKGNRLQVLAVLMGDCRGDKMDQMTI